MESQKSTASDRRPTEVRDTCKKSALSGIEIEVPMLDFDAAAAARDRTFPIHTIVLGRSVACAVEYVDYLLVLIEHRPPASRQNPRRH
jgi:hypothetical protein